MSLLRWSPLQTRTTFLVASAVAIVAVTLFAACGAAPADPAPSDPAAASQAAGDATALADAVTDTVDSADAADAAGCGAACVDTSSDVAATADAGAAPTDPAETCGAAVDAAGAADAEPFCPDPLPPAEGVDTGIGPMPAPLACQQPLAELFKGVAPGPASVKVDLGVNDATSLSFKPFAEGQWLPMVHGFQPGFHINVAIRLRSKQLSESKLKVQLEVRLYDCCKVVGYTLTPVVIPVRDAAGDYLYPAAQTLGTALRFLTEEGLNIAPSDAGLFCNRWYRLRVVVREWKTGAWGETALTIKTYNTQTAKQ